MIMLMTQNHIVAQLLWTALVRKHFKHPESPRIPPIDDLREIKTGMVDTVV